MAVVNVAERNARRVGIAQKQRESIYEVTCEKDTLHAEGARGQQVCLNLSLLKKVTELFLLGGKESVLRVLEDEVESHEAHADGRGLMLAAISIVFFANGRIDRPVVEAV